MALTGGIFSTWKLEICSKTQNKAHSFLGHRSGRYRETTVFDHTNLDVSRNNHQILGEGRHWGGLSCLHLFCFLNSSGEGTCLLEWKGDGLWYHHSWQNPRIANATTTVRAGSALGEKLWCVHFVKMKACLRVLPRVTEQLSQIRSPCWDVFTQWFVPRLPIEWRKAPSDLSHFPAFSDLSHFPAPARAKHIVWVPVITGNVNAWHVLIFFSKVKKMRCQQVSVEC